MHRLRHICLFLVFAVLVHGAVLLGQEGILSFLTPNRTRLEKKLKQIGLAMHNYHDVFKSFPPSGLEYRSKQKTPHPDGTPPRQMLSWRVRLLPFVGQTALYQQFNFNETWDGPTNKPLLEKMPDIYKMPGDKTRPNETVIQAVTMAPDAKQFLKLRIEAMPDSRRRTCTVFDGIFDGKRINTLPSARMATITDGTSNSIMIVEVDTDRAVPWTKPQDLAFEFDKPWAGLGKLRRGGFNAGFADGSVSFVSKEGVSDRDLRLLFLISDNQPIPPNLRRSALQRVRY